MKKVVKWTEFILLMPVLLFLICAGLLYLPPIQNWVVDRVADVVSENTGMQVRVGHVLLEWPLTLAIYDFQAIYEKDTLANVRELKADVQLWPLFKKRIVIDELSLSHADINTNGFISDMRVKGYVGKLWVSSRGIDLDNETMEVNGASLADADLDIALSDTAAVDTTTTHNCWRINADSLTVDRTAVHVHLPGDTIHIGVYMDRAVARLADIDLDEERYGLSSFDLHGGRLDSISGYSLSDVSLGVDSIRLSPQGTSLYVRQAAMKELRTGIELTQLQGGVRLDTAFTHLELPHLLMRTTDSDLEAEVDMDFSALDTKSHGKARVRLNAQLGKSDVVRFLNDMPARFIQQYPNHPLTIKGSVNGNMERLELTGVDLALPTAFSMQADGVIQHVIEPDRLRAQFSIKAETHHLDFIAALPSMPTGLRIPAMKARGRVEADGKRYDAELTVLKGRETVRAKGRYNGTTETYTADIDVNGLNIHDFLPKDSIYRMTANIKAEGSGFDLLRPNTQLTLDAHIAHLDYGHWNLDDIKATARLKDGHGTGHLESHNQLLDGTVGFDAILNSKRIEATIDTDLQMVDLYELRLVDKAFVVGMAGQISLISDLKHDHQLKGRLGNLYIQDEQQTFRPEDLGVYLNTNQDTTIVRLQSGDLIVKADATGGYERLLDQMSILADSVTGQLKRRVIDQSAVRRLFPAMRIYVSSGKNNPLVSVLKSYNISYKDFFLDLSISPVTGLNGVGHLYALNYDSTRIDTIRLGLKQKGDRLTYQAQLRNRRNNPQLVFNAYIDGHLHEHGALAGLRYFDAQDRLGVRLGATAEMEQDGIRIRFMPERPTIGYKEFNLNKDNFILLRRDKPLQAKVDFVADDHTGLKIYTDDQQWSEDAPSPYLQDLTVSVNMLNLDELTSVMPFLPRLTGHLNGDFHIVQDQQENFSVASDLNVKGLNVENSPIGNLTTELVYLMKDEDTHTFEARLMLDDEEFGLLSGTYQNADQGLIDATFTMTRFPLSVANGFVPNQIVGLEGFGEGTLTIKGTTSRPVVDGEVYIENGYLVSVPYSVRMRFDDDPVRIVGSHLLIENFGLYAYNEEPLNMKGEIDFSNTDRITMDLQMAARNLLLINSKQTAKSLVFGKAFVNFFGRLRGPVSNLSMRGKLDVLGSTDMTYMLLDSPLSTDNRLEELVKFTDFSDSTEMVVEHPAPSGVNADLTVSVSQGARVLCNLNVEQTNYIDIMGGGDLRLLYNADGINLTGRYTVNSGLMKYSLPIIPLKTFTIANGSYVEFTGDAMNPRLNITATERTKASVGDEMNGTRAVTFDCGVVITKTLSDMGLQFVIDAPEDQMTSGELATMSEEERGKVAVTMLTTGMYVADGNTSGFSMNSALSSFLQKEINQIAGSALKTFDVQLGFDNTTDASGTIHTDYSFKFAKRFMDNRLNIQIGGKVSSGADTYMGQNQSFFDNVMMEYRLNEEGTMNVKLFYNQNVYDWLEGYTGEYGGGFIWRRKLDRFSDILKIWSHEKK